MDTITLLKLRVRGWLGWEFVDVGMQRLAHRVAPREIAAAEVVR